MAGEEPSAWGDSVWEGYNLPLSANLIGPLVRRFRLLVRLVVREPEKFALVLRNRLVLSHRRELTPGSGLAIGPMMAIPAVGLFVEGLIAGVVALAGVPSDLLLAGVALLLALQMGLMLVIVAGATLFDPEDIHVLSYRPVEGRTLFAGRMAQVALVVVLLAMFFVPLAALLGALAYRSLAFPLALLLTVMLATMLAVAGVALLNGVALRLLGARRFQQFFLWVQIGITAIGVNLAVIVHLVPQTWVADADPRAILRSPLNPFAWFGALDRLLSGSASSGDPPQALLAVLLPIVVAAVAATAANRHFVAALASGPEEASETSVRWPAGLASRAAARLVSGADERGGFGLGYALAGRERKLLLTVAPLAGLAVYLVVSNAGIINGAEGEQPPAFLRAVPRALPYAIGLTLFSLAQAIAMGDRPEASRSLDAMPMRDRNAFLRGALAGAWLRVALPIALILVVFGLLFAGFGALPDLIIALLLGTAIGLEFVRPMRLPMPFSQSEGQDVQWDNLDKSIGCMFCLALVAALHIVAILWVPVGARVLIILPMAWWLPSAWRRCRPEVTQPGLV